MAKDHKKCYEELMMASGKLAQNCSGVMEGFGKLHEEALKEGALSVKDKELISLGIAIAVKCEGCIQCHVKAAIEEGASKEELCEAIGVAVLMAGGPGTIYASIAIEAMNQFFE